EGSEERSGRTASDRSCAEGSRLLCRPLRNQLRTRVCLRHAPGRKPRRNRRSDGGGLSSGAGESEEIRVAGDSVCGVVVPDRGEPDIGLLAAGGGGSTR